MPVDDKSVDAFILLQSLQNLRGDRCNGDGNATIDGTIPKTASLQSEGKPVIAVVLVVNLLIGLICLGVAWQLWQLKHQLAELSHTLLSVEQVIYDVLHPAPGYIRQGQTGVGQLRQKYQSLQPQLQRLEQGLALIGLGRLVWRRFSFLQQPKLTKRRSK